jgi:DNA polymerase III subunit chi
MTEIAFHFNVPDLLEYACRLIRKAYARGANVTVLAGPELAAQLDELLWTFSVAEFLPHSRHHAGKDGLVQTPILLLGSLEGAPHQGLLVNLSDEAPDGFERFERLIEVVTADPSHRQAARGRWKYYLERGYALKQHDLAFTGETA